jgi:hypothetical protein
MLQFYGLPTDNSSTYNPEALGYKNLENNKKDHNYRRISRILKSCKIHAPNTNLAKHLYTSILKKNGGPVNIEPSFNIDGEHRDKAWEFIVNNYKKPALLPERENLKYGEAYQIKEKELYAQKLIIPDNSNVFIIGDLHSSLESLIQILIRLNRLGIFKTQTDEFILKENNYIIFLGDLVDRGPYSIEILLIVIKLKLLNKKKVFIINGNHEDFNTYKDYGLRDEYEVEDPDNNITNKIKKFLNLLPGVIFLKFQNGLKWFQLCHGGIDSKYNPATFLKGNDIFKKINNLKYDYNGLKLSDFRQDQEKFVRNEHRNIGEIWGPKSSKKYLNSNNLYSIISGHQDYTNFGLLIDDNNNKLDLNLFNNSKCNDLYSLYCLQNKENKNNDNKIFNLNPTTDFLALITSSCIDSKSSNLLNSDTFLQLTAYDHEKNLRNNRMDAIKLPPGHKVTPSILKSKIIHKLYLQKKQSPKSAESSKLPEDSTEMAQKTTPQSDHKEVAPAPSVVTGNVTIIQKINETFKKFTKKLSYIINGDFIDRLFLTVNRKDYKIWLKIIKFLEEKIKQNPTNLENKFICNRLITAYKLYYNTYYHKNLFLGNSIKILEKIKNLDNYIEKIKLFMEFLENYIKQFILQKEQFIHSNIWFNIDILVHLVFYQNSAVYKNLDAEFLNKFEIGIGSFNIAPTQNNTRWVMTLKEILKHFNKFFHQLPKILNFFNRKCYKQFINNDKIKFMKNYQILLNSYILKYKKVLDELNEKTPDKLLEHCDICEIYYEDKTKDEISIKCNNLKILNKKVYKNSNLKRFQYWSSKFHQGHTKFLRRKINKCTIQPKNTYHKSQLLLKIIDLENQYV